MTDSGVQAMEDHVYKAPGPALVLAGPGTGKTHTLARRVKYLVEELGVNPDHITVITFTAEAAANMRRRMSDERKTDVYLPHDRQPRNVCTMHSYALGIVKAHPEKVGLPLSVTVAPSERLCNLLIEDAAQLCGLVRDSAAEVVSCRRHGACAEDPDADKCRVCRQYRRVLRACGAVDFDDQVFLACRLLVEHSDLREHHQKSCRHLLVDEYQDINAAQFELIRLLTLNQRNGLFAVGDDDQSVYSWRGGTPRFIRSFVTDFHPLATVYPLTLSRRCHPHILEGALEVVTAHDDSRIVKGPYRYAAPDGPKISVMSVPTDRAEAEEIARIADRTLPDRDLLILVPTRLFVPLIAAELRKRDIGCLSSVAPPGEGLPTLRVFRCWCQVPEDNLLLRQCIQAVVDHGSLGIPSGKSRRNTSRDKREKALDCISKLWVPVIEQSRTLWESIESGDCELVVKLRETLSRLRGCYQGGVAGLLSFLSDEVPLWRSSHALLTELERWADLANTFTGSVSRVAKVTTLQGAKGLEAKVVCIAGLEEGVLPANDVKRDLAEAARLAYVSMTRAREELYLFHARTRSASVTHQRDYGPDVEKKGRRPSRFLANISSSHKDSAFRRSPTSLRNRHSPHTSRSSRSPA